MLLASSPLVAPIDETSMARHICFVKLDINEIELSSSDDVVEVNVDVTLRENSRWLAKMVAAIRRNLPTPIMFSICRTLQAVLGHQACLQLQFLALRLGLEYVQINLEDDELDQRRLIHSKGRSKIIGVYYHESSARSSPWSDGTMLLQYMKGQSYTRVCTIVIQP